MCALPSPTARALWRWIALLFAASACSSGSSDLDRDAPEPASSPNQAFEVELQLPRGPSLEELLESATCATGISDAAPVPAVVQLVVDTSGSMLWPPGWEPGSGQAAPALPSKWSITRRALSDAVAQLAPSTSLGVNFYPNVGHSGSSCLANETAVRLRSLGVPGSAQRRELEHALENVVPRGGTPTHGAYRYGLQLLGRTAPANAGFVVLITDGAPTYTKTCAGDGSTPVDSAPLIAEAASALQSRGIRTFVIGSPGSEPGRSALSRVAQAGGTASTQCSHDGPSYCHFDMTRETNLGAALQRALSDISERLTPCDYAIPPTPAGRSLDLTRVNVVHSSSESPAQVIGRSPEGCNGDGWTYSDDQRQIVLCESTCARIRSDPSSRVEVLFGCATEFRPPR